MFSARKRRDYIDQSEKTKTDARFNAEKEEIGNGDQLELTFSPRLFSFYFHRKGNRAGIYSNTSSFIGMQRGKKEENKYR